jgi:hypothetical protein
VCRTRVEVQPVLFSIFSISISSSIVAISVASNCRPPQLPLSPLPPSPSLRAANTRQPAVTGHKQTVQMRSSRIKRRAACGGGGTGARGTVQDAAAGWEGMEARVRWGAYKRRIATNPGCISIRSARSVDPLRKPAAMSRSAASPGRYVVGRAAFEPLQRRSAGFHRPDIVESLKCTAGLM